jgi:periplasmic protein TonB
VSGITGHEVGDETRVTIHLESTGSRLPTLSARERVAYWALGAALVLHAVVAIVCLIDWAALLNLALARAETPEAIPVSLVYAPPPPPQPVVEPPQPQVQQQAPITPRMSGADEKTAAKQEDTPEPALPQQKSPPPQPAQQQKKPTPTRPGNKEPASVNESSAEREAAAEPEARKEVPPAPLFHSIRLPSRHGGTGERDTAGDAYLNRMRDMVERHRIYPPASAFPDGQDRVAIMSILVDPSGELVQITTLASSGSTVADEAARTMIQSSTPFPPIPSSYPHIRTLITVEMPIYPTPR